MTGVSIGPSSVPASQIRLTYYTNLKTLLGGAGIGSPNQCIAVPSSTRQATDTAAYWLLTIPPGFPDNMDSVTAGITTKMVEIVIVVRDGLSYAYAIAARYRISYCKIEEVQIEHWPRLCVPSSLVLSP